MIDCRTNTTNNWRQQSERRVFSTRNRTVLESVASGLTLIGKQYKSSHSHFDDKQESTVHELQSQRNRINIEPSAAVTCRWHILTENSLIDWMMMMMNKNNHPIKSAMGKVISAGWHNIVQASLSVKRNKSLLFIVKRWY